MKAWEAVGKEDARVHAAVLGGAAERDSGGFRIDTGEDDRMTMTGQIRKVFLDPRVGARRPVE